MNDKDITDFLNVAENISNGETCFWRGFYLTLQKQGKMKDYLLDQGCDLCCGVIKGDYFCHEYHPFKQVIRSNYDEFMRLI